MKLEHGKHLAVNFGFAVTKLMIALGLDTDSNQKSSVFVPEIEGSQPVEVRLQREKESRPTPSPEATFWPKPPGLR